MTPDRAAWTKRLGAGVAPTGRQKYGARAVVVDGIRFDSTKEARRFGELCLLVLAGDISELQVHPTYTIDVVPLSIVTSGARLDAAALICIGVYTADFRYRTAAGDVVVEDVKSAATRKLDAYRLRKRLVEAIYGITISEV